MSKTKNKKNTPILKLKIDVSISINSKETIPNIQKIVSDALVNGVRDFEASIQHTHEDQKEQTLNEKDCKASRYQRIENYFRLLRYRDIGPSGSWISSPYRKKDQPIQKPS